MILFQPAQRIGDQKVTDFVASIIEDICSPVWVFCLASICVFVKMCSIKITERVTIFGKVGSHPIENPTYTRLMADVYDVHKILSGSKTPGWPKITGGPMAP